MKKKFIPVSEPFLNGNEKKYVNHALDTNWISSRGEYVDLFENKFASYSGVNYATSVSNGTNAIHLGLKALDIKSGDEVILPDFTMICSALPIIYLGATPVFVDAERETWNIDPRKIEEKITCKTKAIMVVHIYGHPCDMKPIKEIAKNHNLKIIEDAAEAHGAQYFGNKCGNFGDLAAFSFFSNKVITTGEGGMVTTNDIELYNKLRYYKDLCFPLSGERTYIHQDIGFQYRFSNIQAAIGLAQVEKIDEYIEMRRKNNDLFQKYLSDVSGITFQPQKPECKNIYWVNAAVVDEDILGISRDELCEELLIIGIQTRKFFVPMHHQPALMKYSSNIMNDYPISNWLSKNGFYFPSSTHLKPEIIKYICDETKKIIWGKRK
jgi:perosamine synthetase